MNSCYNSDNNVIKDLEIKDLTNLGLEDYQIEYIRTKNIRSQDYLLIVGTLILIVGYFQPAALRRSEDLTSIEEMSWGSGLSDTNASNADLGLILALLLSLASLLLIFLTTMDKHFHKSKFFVLFSAIIAFFAWYDVFSYVQGYNVDTGFDSRAIGFGAWLVLVGSLVNATVAAIEFNDL